MFITIDNVVIHASSLGIVPQTSSVTRQTYFNLTATCHKESKPEHRVVTEILTSPYQGVCEIVKDALLLYAETNEQEDKVEVKVVDVNKEDFGGLDG